MCIRDSTLAAGLIAALLAAPAFLGTSALAADKVKIGFVTTLSGPGAAMSPAARVRLIMNPPEI